MYACIAPLAKFGVMSYG